MSPPLLSIHSCFLFVTSVGKSVSMEIKGRPIKALLKGPLTTYSNHLERIMENSIHSIAQHGFFCMQY